MTTSNEHGDEVPKVKAEDLEAWLYSLICYGSLDGDLPWPTRLFRHLRGIVAAWKIILTPDHEELALVHK